MRKKIIPYNPSLVPIAKQLRKNSTRSEIRLWGHLRNKEMLGYDFDRQKPVDNYILDFFCSELMLGIELDGFTHRFEEVYAKDLAKEARLKELGITILRFDDKDIMNDIQNVIRVIEMYIEEHSQHRE